MVTQNVACDYTTGEWKVSNVQESCTTADYNVGATQACGSNYCGGNKTLRAISCNASEGTWSYDWNDSGCKTTDSTMTYYSSCSGYYTGSGTVYSTRYCTNGSWRNGGLSFYCSGCSLSEKPGRSYYVAVSTGQCASGYGTKTLNYTCSGSSWVENGSSIACVTTARETCYASLDVACYNQAWYGYQEGGAAAANPRYDASTGKCSSAGCVESMGEEL